MSVLQTLRYSTQGTEFRLTDKAPEVGDILKRNGDNWVVEEVHEADDGSTVVTLRPGPVIEPEPDDE